MDIFRVEWRTATRYGFCSERIEPKGKVWDWVLV